MLIEHLALRLDAKRRPQTPGTMRKTMPRTIAAIFTHMHMCAANGSGLQLRI